MREIIYGKNAVLNALEGNRTILQVYVVKSPNLEVIVKKLQAKKIKCRFVEKHELDRLTKGNHQGVVAEISSFDYSTLEEILTNQKGSFPFVVILDGIEDPHNLGAIIRTAEAAGVDGIVLPKHRSAKITDTVVKVSTGAVEFMKIALQTNLTETIKTLKKSGFWIVGAEYDKKSVDYRTLKYDMPITLVIGSEGKGLSRLVKENCDFLVKIPMKGKVTSLNASVSAAILIYEIIKYQ